MYLHSLDMEGLLTFQLRGSQKRDSLGKILGCLELDGGSNLPIRIPQLTKRHTNVGGQLPVTRSRKLWL